MNIIKENARKYQDIIILTIIANLFKSISIATIVVISFFGWMTKSFNLKYIISPIAAIAIIYFLALIVLMIKRKSEGYKDIKYKIKDFVLINKLKKEYEVGYFKLLTIYKTIEIKKGLFFLRSESEFKLKDPDEFIFLILKSIIA